MPTQATLAEARTFVREYLDDRAGKRWSTSVVDLALRTALSACVDDYRAEGGDRFDEDADVTTGSDGTVSLASYDPLDVAAVLADVSGGYVPIMGGDRYALGQVDQTARDLRVVLVRRYAVPTDPDDLLVGVSTGAARSWPAFDQWVCARAALQLGTTDDDRRQALRESLAECRRSALSHARAPRVMPWGDAAASRSPFGSLLGRMRWVYDANARVLSLYFGR